MKLKKKFEISMDVFKVLKDDDVKELEKYIIKDIENRLIGIFGQATNDKSEVVIGYEMVNVKELA